MKKFVSFLMVLTVGVLVTFCGSQSDKDYFESAQSNKEAGKYVEALADFEMLVEEYPDSEYQVKALFEIGKMYQTQVNKNISKEESIQKAVDSYYTIFKKHPDSQQAPSSLFMVAFLNANELFKLDTARETYELFIQKYPDNELVPSAQAELENLGLTPEEILQKKINNAD